MKWHTVHTISYMYFSVNSIYISWCNSFDSFSFAYKLRFSNIIWNFNYYRFRFHFRHSVWHLCRPKRITSSAIELSHKNFTFHKYWAWCLCMCLVVPLYAHIIPYRDKARERQRENAGNIAGLSFLFISISSFGLFSCFFLLTCGCGEYVKNEFMCCLHKFCMQLVQN